MSLADDWLDRRALRRSVGLWRILAILGAFATGILGFGFANGGFGAKVSEPHIAKIRIEGTISEDEKLLALIKEAGEDETVKGILLAVDSPGGTTAGGEAIYEAIRKLAQKKPVVAQIGTLAASAGYMIAAAADQIVARKSSIVGSIGVLFQYPDLTELLNKAGVKVETIKSSPLKAEPNPFNPASEDAKSMIRAIILDSYDWFVSVVDERRPLDRAQTLALADGSVFTGRQALSNKLIDAIGGEEKAIEWLNGKGIPKELKVIEWKPKVDDVPWWLATDMSASLLRFFGLKDDASGLIGPILSDKLLGNGLLSVWSVDSLLNGRN